MTQMAFALSVSLSLPLSRSLSGFAAVATESRMRGGGSGSGEECEGDGERGEGSVMEQVNERSESQSSLVMWGGASSLLLLQCVFFCVCDWLCSSSERQKHNECVLRDWTEVCKLRITLVCTAWLGHVACPLRLSKIGHLRSSHHTISADRERLWRETKSRKKTWKGATKCCKSVLVIQVYMWGFWFVFSAVLICSAESSMLKFGLFSAPPGERQILSDCTSQTQFNIWKGFTCKYAK